MAEVVSKAASVSALSSPSSSTESTFRELDDVFLQSQAKIWIGEILQTRLNEDISIADLLADGELLYEVSREIWSMLATKRTELRGSRSRRYDPFVSRKSSGRYRPYSNVDSFLKICKILGLSGIDLFSPSDVVEKRNTRKVCMCIRSLSKKVRSTQLNVLDFDIVTCTVAMPTDMVGYIRRSWEMSHCSPSSSAASSSHCSYQNSRQSRRQNRSIPDSERKYDIYNEESDEAESDMMFQSDSQTNSFSYDTSSRVNSELLDSHEVSSVPKDYSCQQCSTLLKTRKQEKDEYGECCCEAESMYKSMESFHSQNLECDHQEHSTLFPSFDSNDQFESRELDMRFVDSNIEDNASVVADSDGNTPMRTKFGDQSDLSIFTFDGACKVDDTLLHGEDYKFHACVNTGSCGLKTSPVNLNLECRSKTSDDDDMEVSSVASMSSTSDAVQKLAANDYVHAEEYFGNLSSDKSSICNLDWGKNITGESKFQENIALETREHGLTLVSEDASISDMQVSDKLYKPVLDRQYTDEYLDHVSTDNKGIFLSQMNSDAVYEESKDLINDHSQVGFHQWDLKGKCRVPTPSSMNDNHTTPSILAPEVDSQKDILIQTKATENALCHDDKKFNISSNDIEVLSNTASESGTCEPLLEMQTSSGNGCSQNEGKCTDQGSRNQHNHLIQSDEDADRDDSKREKVQELAIKRLDRTRDLSAEESENKPQRRLLIKSVASGTAVLGAVLLYIHLRKNGGQKSGKSDKQSSQTRKAKSRDISTQNWQKGNRSNRVYSSEKLKLGN